MKRIFTCSLWNCIQAIFHPADVALREELRMASKQAAATAEDLNRTVILNEKQITEMLAKSVNQSKARAMDSQ